MSAIGSVISAILLKARSGAPGLRPWALSLPAALDHAGDLAAERELAETETAQGELPEKRARPAALAAAVTPADVEPGPAGVFYTLCSCRHLNTSRELSIRPERHPQQLE